MSGTTEAFSSFSVDDDELPDMPPNDAEGVMHVENGEAEIAWFSDPAGDVLAVVSSAMPG